MFSKLCQAIGRVDHDPDKRMTQCPNCVQDFAFADLFNAKSLARLAFAAEAVPEQGASGHRVCIGHRFESSNVGWLDPRVGEGGGEQGDQTWHLCY